MSQPADLDEWRSQARALIIRRIRPGDVSWRVGDQSPDLFASSSPSASAVITGPDEKTLPDVPRRFVTLAGTVICHNDPARFSLLYLLLWRIVEGERRVLDIASDPAVHRASMMVQSVQRDIHKMKAFVRFRKVEEEHAEHYVAWFEPEHFIVERTAPFFAERFAAMTWSILTPNRSAHWDRERLSFGPGTGRTEVPSGDALEDVWRQYYASIFNPARLKLKAMKTQMPIKYWTNLPEARLIAPLATAAGSRTRAMFDASTSKPHRRRGRRADPQSNDR